MQGAYTSQLLKRGVHFANECMKYKQAGGGRGQIGHARARFGLDTTETPLEELARRFQSPAAIIALGITLLCFLFFTSAIDYAVNTVVTNLAIVEDTDGGRIALSVSDEPDTTLSKIPLLDDFEGKSSIHEVPAKPITSKLRTAFCHLNSVGGFRARFRGLRFAAFYHIVLSVFSAILQAVFSPLGPLGFWAGSTVAAILCCNVHAAWTHATISTPSEKRFFQRFLPRSIAKQLMLPTLRLHIAIGILHAFTVGSTYLAIRLISDPSIPRYLSINMAVLPVFMAISIALVAVLPSYIALIRTEASLLPEDMSAIVPFDRTFSGRFLQDFGPRCAYIFKNLSMRGAWTLFDRETYRRVVKIQVKFFIIALSIFMLFAGIFLAEGVVIAGGQHNVKRIFEYIREHEKL